jgi:two-component sensor histidine kinase
MLRKVKAASTAAAHPRQCPGVAGIDDRQSGGPAIRFHPSGAAAAQASPYGTGPDDMRFLVDELVHRIDNIFAVVTALVRMEARDHPELAPAAARLVRRIEALSAAHAVARPAFADRRSADRPLLIGDLLDAILAPYGAADGRIAIGGDPIPFGAAAATPLALVFHELATNAAKHGPLARPDGSLRVSSRMEASRARIEWLEDCPAAVVGIPRHSGFGTRLIDRTVQYQLGGTIVRAWRPHGMLLTLDLPLAGLLAPG